jgi:hypothetical protein
VVGYPPFLKVLLDEGTRRGMDWSTFDMQALLGGEGNSEALRDYLLRHFRTVYSGYGVTDVEIGMAAETPVTPRPKARFLSRSSRVLGRAPNGFLVVEVDPCAHARRFPRELATRGLGFVESAGQQFRRDLTEALPGALLPLLQGSQDSGVTIKRRSRHDA